MADAMAVMRAGRLVQHGALAQVWQHPADSETALFLGYARVLTGEPARQALAVAGLPPAAGAVALRRSALRLVDDGPLSGVVRSARATPEQVRLVVDVGGLGAVDAVAPLGSHAGPGDTVRLAVDATRVAVLPAPSASGGPASPARP
ncbi:MAG: hypothetical protein R2734_03935 [Nocardioides sp.]